MPTPTRAPAPGAAGAAAVLRVLRDGRPRTRAELALTFDWARSTLGARIDALQELGLVAPVGAALSTGGRPSTQLAIVPEARLVAAADLGASHASVALLDLLGRPLRRRGERLAIAAGPDAVLSWMVRTIDALLAEQGRDRADLLGIGIGLPGPVRHDTGRPVSPPLMPGWHDADVPGRVRADIDVPVLVDNDVNIMALGEHSTGFPDAADLLFVKVATGIGAGIIADGELRRGAVGVAGDLGHVRVARGAGVRCACGNEGCLEALAGWPALAATLRAEGRAAQTSDDVIRLAADGDAVAVATLRRAGRDVGEVLATSVNLINPSVVAIGGSLARAGEQLLAGVREVVYARSNPTATEHLTITRSRAGADAAVIGAGILALDATLGPAGIAALLRGGVASSASPRAE